MKKYVDLLHSSRIDDLVVPLLGLLSLWSFLNNSMCSDFVAKTPAGPTAIHDIVSLSLYPVEKELSIEFFRNWL